MTATDIPPITCPVCDAPNAARSLYCAECGSPLKESSDGDTAAIASTESAGQSTAVISVADRWQSPDASPQSGNDAPASSGSGDVSSPEPVENPWVVLPPKAAPPSRRGFWLGIIAALLMLTILLLWIWAAVLDQSTRNSIGDLFGFLN